MPRRDGIEFLRAVRKTHPDLPFVLFTGKGSEEIASEAISAGVTDYLEKKSGSEQYALLTNRVRNAVERYRAQQAAEHSRHRLERTYERVTDGFVAVDTDWRYTYVNEEAARLLDSSREELLGETIWEVFTGLRNTPLEETLRTAMETQETTTVEAHYPPLDSWFTVRAYPDENGLSIFFRDITERKERERKLRRERQQYETLFETLPVPVLHGRAEDGEPVVEDANQAFETLHEATSDLMTATSVDEIADIGSTTATEVLDLPVNAIHLSDSGSEDEALRPVSWSDQTDAFEGPPPAISPGDGLVWEAHAAGEPRVYTDVTGEPKRFNPDTECRSELDASLGDHGVLIAGSRTPEDFDRTPSQRNMSTAHRLSPRYSTRCSPCKWDVPIEACLCHLSGEDSRSQARLSGLLRRHRVSVFV